MSQVMAARHMFCDNADMPHRFVLLRHECPEGFSKPSHWDFMLEAEGVLLTWELCQLPAAWSTALGLETQEYPSTVPAARLADHRLDYLQYEGPLSGDRGSVRRVACGTYEVREENAQRLIVELQGSLLRGSVTIAQKERSWRVGETA